LSSAGPVIGFPAPSSLPPLSSLPATPAMAVPPTPSAATAAPAITHFLSLPFMGAIMTSCE
jgi:hypothetical protein